MQELWDFIKDNSGTVVTLSTIIGGTIAFFKLRSKKYKDKKSKEIVDTVLKVLESESFVCVRGSMNNSKLEEIIKNQDYMTKRADVRKNEQIIQFKSVQTLQSGVSVLLQHAQGEKLNGQVRRTISELEKDRELIKNYLSENLQ